MISCSFEQLKIVPLCCHCVLLFNFKLLLLIWTLSARSSRHFITMSRNERSPAIDLGQLIFGIKNCSLFVPINSHLIGRVLSRKSLTFFSNWKGDQYEFFTNEGIHFRIFLNATKSNKTTVFEVSLLRVYGCFRDTQRIDFAPSYHRSPIIVRRKPKIHCHCFLLLFFLFFILLVFSLP